MPKVSSKASKIIESPIREIIAKIEKAGDDPSIISLGGGASNINPPAELITFLKEKLEENPQKIAAYGSTKGHPNIRKAISEYIYQEQNIKIDPSSELMLTTGSTEGIFLAMEALIEQNDEVILADPTYCYAEPLTLLGATIIPIKVELEKNFQLDITKIKNAITNKTKLIILLSPDNPTGRMITKEIIEQIILLAKKHDFWIISDETYQDLTYSKKHYSVRVLAEQLDAKNNIITCCSFSKSLCIPGLRIGYIYGPKSVIEITSVLRQYTTMFPSQPSQLLAKRIVNNNAEIKKEFIRKILLPEYKKRRESMDKCLKEFLPKGKYNLPDGAFYFFVDFSYYINKKEFKTSKEFCEKLFEEEQVVVIPGSFFGKESKNFIRLTFAAENGDRIKEGIERISRFVNH